MDVPPATALAFRVTLPLDQLDTMTTAGLQQDTREKPLHSLLSLCTCLADAFPKYNCDRQLAEQPHLSGYGSREVLLFHISHKEQLLPPSHCSQGQRRQHRPHRGNKVPVRQLRAQDLKPGWDGNPRAEALQQNKVVTYTTSQSFSARSPQPLEELHMMGCRWNQSQGRGTQEPRLCHARI